MSAQGVALDALGWLPVVAKQAQVPGPTAGCDTRQNGNAQTANRFADQAVEIRSAGRLELGLAAWLHGQPTQAISYQQNDLAVTRLAELAQELMNLHSG